MKNNRRFIAFVIALFLIANVLMIYTTQAFAHEEMLEITYDYCVATEDHNDIDEMWYVLN